MGKELTSVSRVIEESVPGKQVTIAHVIASPVPEVYECLGIDAAGAIGILTLSPFETAIIAADIAAKAADVTLMDVRLGVGIGGKSFAVLTGEVAAVEEAVRCGMAAGEEKGLAVTSTVIPSPRKEIFDTLL